MKDIVDHVEKVDAMTVKFVLKKPEAPFMANMAMDFASILSAEYADKMMAAKTPDVIDREPIGTGPFQFVSYQKDAVIRYKAFDALLGRPAEDRQPGLRDHDRRLGALRQAEDRRVPRDGLSEAGRRRADEERSEHQPGLAARPQRRLRRLQRREEAVRLQAGAPGAEHGGQQEGDPRQRSSRAPARSPRTRSRRPSGRTTTRSSTTPTTRPRRRRCWRRPATRTASTSSSGTCR